MAYVGASGALYSFDIRVRENEYASGVMNQQDLDRNFCLATTNIFKWMQAARMELPWMQAGYRAFCEVHPKTTRRMLVGSQMIKLEKPGILDDAVDNQVFVRVEIGDIGRTTIEFRYKIFFGSRLAGTGSTIMIATAGAPGNFKPCSVPDDVRALASPDNSENAADMKGILAKIPKQAPADAYESSVVIRYSDEDVNKHANHSAQARFFEDAKETIAQDEAASEFLRAIAKQNLQAIYIAYTAEARALDRVTVKVATSMPDVLDVWVERTHPAPGPIARGRMICCGGLVDNADERRLRTSKL